MIRDGKKKDVKVVLAERPKELRGEGGTEKSEEENYKKLGLSIKVRKSGRGSWFAKGRLDRRG